MAGVPIPVSEIDTNTFRVRPSGRKDGDLRVLFVHGGGASDSRDTRQSPFALYLSARFENFAMRCVRHTSDFEHSISEHAEEIESFHPDVVVGRSQGGPTILELVHRGLWRGPSVLCCPAIVPGVDDHLMALPADVPFLVVTGAVDEQVPLDRVTDFVKANALRLRGGLRLCVVNDRHGLRSLCDDERPATVLDAMAPPIETRREVPSEAVTLYDLVRSCWDLRLRCQQPYRHEARIGASAAPAATDPPPPHGADERGVERKTTVAPLSRRAWRGLRRLWRLQESAVRIASR